MHLIRSLCLLSLLCVPAAAVADVKVLGKLGQALEPTPIYANTSTKARVYYRVKAYEYLVVQDFKYPEWRKVLLQNGKFGYVQSEKVAALPYEVTLGSAAQRPTSQSSRAGGNWRGQIAQSSLNFVGTPYKWGGNDLNGGIDCSGFVKQLFGSIGVSLPRTAAEQVKVGQPVARYEDLQGGDRLYFWDAKRGKVGHTGIYLGNNYFSHASSGKGQVSTDFLFQEKWLKILVAARR